MYSNKYLMKLINYFLPRQAEIVRIGEDYQMRAILEVDLDGDLEEELVSLYRKTGENYLLVLKKRGRRWYVVWNQPVGYQNITQFEVAKLVSRQRQIILGGRTNAEEPSRLSVLTWKQTGIETVEIPEVTFDKLYIQRLEESGELDQIILWQHQELEAYMIDVYRYKEGKLVKDAELDHYYFEMIVKYYTYLCEREPEEKLYEVCLEEAKRRCLPRAHVHIEDVTANEELGDRDKPLGNKIEKSIANKEILEIISGYLQDIETEQEIYLWGKKEIENGREMIHEATLILNNAAQQAYEMMPIPSEKFYSYQLRVGDFTGNGLDDIWIGIEEPTGKRVMIYTLQNQRLTQIWDTAYLEQGEYEVMQSVLEIYAIDKMLRGKYEVWYVQASKDQTAESLEKVMTCVKWEGQRMAIYKQYKIQE